LFLTISVFSQGKDKLGRITVTGIVYDIGSPDPLPYSHIAINQKRTLITDSKGYFRASLVFTDTLTFSHLGYDTTEIVLPSLITNCDSLHINVQMKEKIYEIPEVIIFPYKTYGEFKRAILNNNNQELRNVYENIKMMKANIRNGYFPDKDGRECFSYLISYKNSNNNSIAIFSNLPNRGIIPALKKIHNH
jgi:hypothetical protein